MITRALFAATLTLLLAVPATAQQPVDPPAAAMPEHCMQAAMHPAAHEGMGPAAGGTGVQGTPASGLALLLGGPVETLGLTPEQTTALDAVLARAREAALAALTPEQRAALEHTH